MKSIWFTVFPLLGTAILRATATPVPQTSPEETACNNGTVQVRREWGSLTEDERLHFIQSVQCLMDQPSQIPSGLAPGAVNRFHDFTAAHINDTLRIHANGVFLVWHRHFLHLFEAALREECGFQDTIPYVNWLLWADDLLSSPVFDGSATSFGGNGAFDSNRSATAPNGNYAPPAGQGGGCISTGPFANSTVPFRNFAAPVNAASNGGVVEADALNYDPHCFRRNINPAVVQPAYNQSTVGGILALPDIVSFQRRMDSTFYPEGQNIADYGIHVGGHAGTGGEMADLFASPADPVFYLHHGFLELLHTQWREVDPARLEAFNGTDLYFNDPAGTEVSLDYVQQFGYLDEPRRLGDLMSVTEGPYCYRYDVTL